MSSAGSNARKTLRRVIRFMVGDLLAQTVVQGWPLSVKPVGAGFAELTPWVPLNPKLIEPFAPIAEPPVAVTVLLPAGCAKVAFQPGSVTRWSPEKVNASVHPL